jgi:hypothetical protein
MTEYKEGQTATHPKTKQKIVYQGGLWVEMSGPAGNGGGNLTDGQAKDGFNAKRMTGAAEIVEPLEAKGFDYGAAKLTPGFVPGLDDKRKYESAQLEWSDSLIRLTTGAAATKPEIESALKTYFPVTGDSPEVRKQKAAMRARVQADALARAGPGARPSQNPLAAAAAPSSAPGAANTPPTIRGRHSGRHEPAPTNAGQRVKGRVYQTPKGAMQWTGTGWIPR